MAGWHPLRAIVACLLLGALLAWPAGAGAEQIVIYRCIDAFDQVTIQNGTPCPKGSRQERRTVEAVQAMPAFQPPVVVPSPQPTQVDSTLPEADASTDEHATATAADAGEATIDAEALLPPPPLFECHTWDNDRYLSDSGEPAPRCVRMDTVGIGGLSNLGAGEACRMVTDQCQRIGDDAVCEAWARRAREAEAGWRFAPAELAEQRRTELERIRRILRESTCAR
ncbi:MAG: DUF4124 domain-containing protein [Pseudoxanthomonas suwonensis]|nr:DUF4124 domain-containing protein [Pseudoxanthomonas suwonensis]